MTKLKLTDLKAGDTVFTDSVFDCMVAGKRTVHEDNHGLYVKCGCGHHYLDGQLDFDGSDELVGIALNEFPNS